jgi:hypothetical protein
MADEANPASVIGASLREFCGGLLEISALNSWKERPEG